jgi:hypothetical protein
MNYESIFFTQPRDNSVSEEERKGGRQGGRGREADKRGAEAHKRWL